MNELELEQDYNCFYYIIASFHNNIKLIYFMDYMDGL